MVFIDGKPQRGTVRCPGGNCIFRQQRGGAISIDIFRQAMPPLESGRRRASRVDIPYVAAQEVPL